MVRNSETTFSSHWWAVQVPSDWKATEDSQCVTLSGSRSPSALQISAARKERSTVTDADLKDSSSDGTNSELRLKTIDVGAFSGFYAERIEKGVFWREWWLREGYLMIYASYNVDEKFKDAEKLVVDHIIKSLEPK